MLGVILEEMRLFVAQRYGYRAWLETLRRTERSPIHHYELNQTYPDEEFGRLAANAAAVTGTPPLELLEAFGEALVPDMMRVYGYLVEPSWGYGEFVLNMEPLLHEAMRLHAPGAQPTRVRTSRLGPNAVELTYRSGLKACAAVRGVIIGVAREYGVSIDLAEPECVLRGDLQCVFRVEWRSSRAASARR